MNIQQINNIRCNFILTTARTGSTMLSYMLNMHSNVISTREEPFAYNLYPKYKKIKTWTSETIQAFCYDFYLFSEGRLAVQFGQKKDLESLLEAHKTSLTTEMAIKLTYLCFFPDKDKSNITTVVDKQLMFHLCLKKVAAFYPESKFIILHRDPRDNAFTKWRMFGNRKQYKAQNYYRISCAWNYVFSKLLRLKNRIGTERFLEVKYEDLVTNPEIELKKICSFLNITYKDIMLDYNEKIKNELNSFKEKNNKDPLEHFPSFQNSITEKPQTNKIGYWKQNIKQEDANLIWTVCGDLAEKIGYKKDAGFNKQSMTLKNNILYIKILLGRFITNLYHASPFFVKRTLKKMKYGKNFKAHALANE